FLATLAHELRNPLAPLVSGLEIVSLPNCDPGTVERVHAMMGRQLHHMVGLIDDLMDLSRVSRGIVHLEKVRLDLRTVLTEAVETVRSRYDTLEHTLVVDLPEHPLEVDGDTSRLMQVFSNLLTNAAKFTDQGGTLTLRAAEEGSEVLVSVEDNGIGIAQDHLAAVFDMFSQVDRTKQHAQGGLGIGLNIVKHMVELHGGRVEVFSAGLGTGSRFTVFLPKSVALGSASKAALLQQQEAPQEVVPQRILLVDDNQDAANLLANMLTRAGHETQVAFSGPQALEIGAHMLPTVVLMDIGMPGMDGNATCRNMRLTPWGGSIFITAITGWGNLEDRRGTKLAGFDSHLVKPIAKKELMALLATVGGSTIPRA
ncbi:MAG: ATP-binding protein, partial [Flavobacteriales bacterium]